MGVLMTFAGPQAPCALGLVGEEEQPGPVASQQSDTGAGN